MEIGMKERLIGAVVLVLLGIIIIPLFLKGPAPETPTTQPLTLPPASATAIQEYNLALSPSTAAPAVAATQASPVAATPAQVQAPAPAPSKPSMQPIQRPAPAAAPAPTGKWVVQAGSYGSEANASKAVKALQQHGLHAFISRFQKGKQTFFRVRVGPYAERADADKAVKAVTAAVGGKADVVPND